MLSLDSRPGGTGKSYDLVKPRRDGLTGRRGGDGRQVAVKLHGYHHVENDYDSCPWLKGRTFVRQYCACFLVPGVDGDGQQPIESDWTERKGSAPGSLIGKSLLGTADSPQCWRQGFGSNRIFMASRRSRGAFSRRQSGSQLP